MLWSHNAAENLDAGNGWEYGYIGLLIKDGHTEIRVNDFGCAKDGFGGAPDGIIDNGLIDDNGDVDWYDPQNGVNYGIQPKLQNYYNNSLKKLIKFFKESY
jgi:hypothetical protein